MKSGYKTTTLLPLLFLVVSACATSVSTPITESNKDSSGTFDGQWLATAQSTATIQPSINNVRFSCRDLGGEKYSFKVHNSQITMYVGSRRATSFVDTNGRFRLIAPYGNVRATGPTGFRINNTNINFVLSGSLTKENGILTLGYEEFNNRGCNTTLAIKKA